MGRFKENLKAGREREEVEVEGEVRDGRSCGRISIRQRAKEREGEGGG